jgi:hypothetical protein
MAYGHRFNPIMSLEQDLETSLNRQLNITTAPNTRLAAWSNLSPAILKSSHLILVSNRTTRGNASSPFSMPLKPTKESIAADRSLHRVEEAALHMLDEIRDLAVEMEPIEH